MRVLTKEFHRCTYLIDHFLYTPSDKPILSVTDLIKYTYSTNTKEGPSQGLKIRGGWYYCDGHNLPPLVEIGLTDWRKTGDGPAEPI